MKLEPKPSPEHVLSFQNTVLFKVVSKQRSGAVSDGERCFLDLPDTVGSHREGLALSPPTPAEPARKEHRVSGTLGESLTRSWLSVGWGWSLPGITGAS